MQYTYRIRGDHKDLNYIRRMFPGYDYLFNPGGRSWAPTGGAVEEILTNICKMVKEVTVTLEFTNDCENGLILFANGRKRWIR